MFFRVRFFFRPADPLLSSEPGGGQGNLATHTVAQDCMFLSYFLVVHVILFSLCHVISATHFPSSRAVGCAIFPFRVGFRLFVSPHRHDGSLREDFDVGFPCLAPVFSFNSPFFVSPSPPR